MIDEQGDESLEELRTLLARALDCADRMQLSIVGMRISEALDVLDVADGEKGQGSSSCH